MAARQPFEHIVAEHGAVVLRVCRAMLGPVDADDAWSETFLAALRAYPDLRPGSNVRGWLVTIAHNKAIDQLRRAQRAPRPDGALPPAVDAARSDDPAAAPERLRGLVGDEPLRRALQALPPRQRAAVVYHYLADLPYAEVAVLLGGTEAAARRNAADGIAKLRASYGRPGG